MGAPSKALGRPLLPSSLSLMFQNPGEKAPYYLDRMTKTLREAGSCSRPCDQPVGERQPEFLASLVLEGPSGHSTSQMGNRPETSATGGISNTWRVLGT